MRDTSARDNARARRARRFSLDEVVRSDTLCDTRGRVREEDTLFIKGHHHRGNLFLRARVLVLVTRWLRWVSVTETNRAWLF